MRVWVDLTNSPHVLVMRPLIEAMRADGHEVEVTARDFAQTLELCERFGIDHTAIGRHRGGQLASKGLGLVSRSGGLVRWARGRSFDVAMGHGSNDVSVAAALLRIPAATAFDYEFAAQQHHVNCRLCRVVMVPELIPPERLARYGAKPSKLRRYPGLKEEYYLADFEPDEAVLGELGLERDRPLVVVRTPPEVSLYHRFDNPLFRRVLERLAQDGTQAVVLPRTRAQRDELRELGRFVVPEPRRGHPEPGRVRGPGDLGGRDDEPRGRGPRDARLHDVRGPARRRGRGAAARGSHAQAHRRRRGEPGAALRARRRCGFAETRANSSNCSSRPPTR